MNNVSTLRLGILVRCVADGGILAVSTTLALALQYFVLDPRTEDLAAQFTSRLVEAWVFMIPLSLGMFFLMGLYTYARTYALLPKMLRVFQAATLVYLIAGFAHYVLHIEHLLPRRAMLLAWMLTAPASVLGRVWSKLWAFIVLRDHGVPMSLTVCPRESKVLLIGGAGYIGSALLPLLLESGYKVRLLDSFVYGEQPIAPWLDRHNLEILRADFRQIDKVVEAMQGIGTVIHLGGIVGDPACALNEDLTIEVNLIATRMIAEVAKGEKVSRFIFASTCSVYGVSDLVLDENSQLNPVSLYARSKIACEQVLLGLQDDSFLPAILRFGTIYGVSGRTRFDLVVNLLAAKAAIEGEVIIFGSDQWRPFVHVKDAARAVLKACQSRPENLRDLIFNVGSDNQNLTLGQLGQLVVRLVPSARLRCVEENGDRRNYRVSFDRIRDKLEFVPSWTLEQGILQVLEAIRENQVADYRDPKYSNVKFLRDAGREVLKVQNGWAKEMIDHVWICENSVTAAPPDSLAPTSCRRQRRPTDPHRSGPNRSLIRLAR